LIDSKKIVFRTAMFSAAKFNAINCAAIVCETLSCSVLRWTRNSVQLQENGQSQQSQQAFSTILGCPEEVLAISELMKVITNLDFALFKFEVNMFITFWICSTGTLPRGHLNRSTTISRLQRAFENQATQAQKTARDHSHLPFRE